MPCIAVVCPAQSSQALNSSPSRRQSLVDALPTGRGQMSALPEHYQCKALKHLVVHDAPGRQSQVAALAKADGEVPCPGSAAKAEGALVKGTGHAAVVADVGGPLPLGLLLLQHRIQGGLRSVRWAVGWIEPRDVLLL